MFVALISAATYSLAVHTLSTDFLKLFLHTLYIFLIDQLKSAIFMYLCIYFTMGEEMTFLAPTHVCPVLGEDNVC